MEAVSPECLDLLLSLGGHWHETAFAIACNRATFKALQHAAVQGRKRCSRHLGTLLTRLPSAMVRLGLEFPSQSCLASPPPELGQSSQPGGQSSQPGGASSHPGGQENGPQQIFQDLFSRAQLSSVSQHACSLWSMRLRPGCRSPRCAAGGNPRVSCSAGGLANPAHMRRDTETAPPRTSPTSRKASCNRATFSHPRTFSALPQSRRRFASLSMFPPPCLGTGPKTKLATAEKVERVCPGREGTLKMPNRSSKTDQVRSKRNSKAKSYEGGGFERRSRGMLEWECYSLD